MSKPKGSFNQMIQRKIRVADLDDLDPCELAGIPSSIEAHITAVRQAWPEGYPSEVEQGE